FECTPVAEPEPGAFTNIQKLFTHGEDTYMIRRGLNYRLELWRNRDGEWKKLLGNSDEEREAGDYGDPSQRMCVFTDGGLLIGAIGCGPWFVPDDGSKPQCMDWRSGFPLTSIQRMFRLPDGRVFLLSSMDNGRSFIGNLDLPPKPQSGS